jgi:hypothetical protein
MTIEISAEEFARSNKALLTLLKAVAKAGKDGISTRALYAQIKMTGYGDKLVNIAERDGYIVRVRRKQKIDGKGPWYVFNILTKKGQRLLAQLGVS